MINPFTSPVGGNLENIVRGNDNALRDAINTVLASYISGPGSSTDNAIVRWDGTTGQLVQNSAVLVDDNGIVTVSGSGGFTVNTTLAQFGVQWQNAGVNRVIARLDSATSWGINARDTGGGAIDIPILFDPTANGNIRFGGAGRQVGINVGASAFSTVAGLYVRGSYNPSSAVARGMRLDSTQIATANADTMYGVDLAPVFTPGAFTGLTVAALRVADNATVLTGTKYGMIIGAQSGATVANYSLRVLGASLFSGTLTAAADVFAQTDLYVTGLAYATLGTVAQPNVTSLGILTGLTMGGDILPDTDTLYNLGSTSFRWANLYGSSANFSSRLEVAGQSALGGATISASTALILPAGTNGISPMRVPHGVAPTAPVNGDFWSTTAGFYGRVNGSTVGPFGTGGGGGGASATTVEQDLGATATWRGRFTITDAAITATSKVLCWQAPGPYTGKGTRADEAELQPVSIVSVEPATGTAVVTWETPPGFTQQVILPDGRRFLAVAARDGQMMLPDLIPRRVGKVRGNVKFSYMVLS
jgi:hypothetical protein